MTAFRRLRARLCWLLGRVWCRVVRCPLMGHDFYVYPYETPGFVECADCGKMKVSRFNDDD